MGTDALPSGGDGDGAAASLLARFSASNDAVGEGGGDGELGGGAGKGWSGGSGPVGSGTGFPHFVTPLSLLPTLVFIGGGA